MISVSILVKQLKLIEYIYICILVIVIFDKNLTFIKKCIKNTYSCTLKNNILITIFEIFTYLAFLAKSAQLLG